MATPSPGWWRPGLVSGQAVCACTCSVHLDGFVCTCSACSVCVHACPVSCVVNGPPSPFNVRRVHGVEEAGVSPQPASPPGPSPHLPGGCQDLPHGGIRDPPKRSKFPSSTLCRNFLTSLPHFFDTLCAQGGIVGRFSRAGGGSDPHQPLYRTPWLPLLGPVWGGPGLQGCMGFPATQWVVDGGGGSPPTPRPSHVSRGAGF